VGICFKNQKHTQNARSYRSNETFSFQTTTNKSALQGETEREGGKVQRKTTHNETKNLYARTRSLTLQWHFGLR